MPEIFQEYIEIIPEYRLFIDSLHRPFPNHVRINTLKADPEALINSFQAQGVNVYRSCPIDGSLVSGADLESPGNLLEYFLGYIHPQALTSCLAALALSPTMDSYVLDICASPGGKTSHLAQLMENSGLIIANELYPSRHLPLGHTLDRLGVLNTIITAYQAQEFPLKQRFDYVLADLPCSGEGRVRKTNKGFNHRNLNRNKTMTDLQKKILLRAFDLLKNGGEMLYATCTYNPDENESVVDHLLQNRAAELLSIPMAINYSPGITEWRHHSYDKSIERAARFYPHYIDSVGFFMARVVKRG
jgi:NOL1/NOP2/sun family putative RNA methylase